MNRTDWNKPDEIPLNDADHIGVYERDMNYGFDDTPDPVFAYWDGKTWYKYVTSVEGAIEQYDMGMGTVSTTPELPWRGLSAPSVHIEATVMAGDVGEQRADKIVVNNEMKGVYKQHILDLIDGGDKPNLNAEYGKLGGVNSDCTCYPDEKDAAKRDCLNCPR